MTSTITQPDIQTDQTQQIAQQQNNTPNQEPQLSCLGTVMSKLKNTKAAAFANTLSGICTAAAIILGGTAAVIGIGFAASFIASNPAGWGLFLGFFIGFLLVGATAVIAAIVAKLCGATPEEIRNALLYGLVAGSVNFIVIVLVGLAGGIGFSFALD